MAVKDRLQNLADYHASVVLAEHDVRYDPVEQRLALVEISDQEHFAVEVVVVHLVVFDYIGVVKEFDDAYLSQDLVLLLVFQQVGLHYVD